MLSFLFLQKKKKVEEVQRTQKEGMLYLQVADLHSPSTCFFSVLLDLFECV